MNKYLMTAGLALAAVFVYDKFFVNTWAQRNK